jgi:phytoene dehydrogenase-like protein
LSELRQKTESIASIFIGIGIRAEITQNPIPKWQLEEPFSCAGKKITEINFNNYSGHKGYAPAGCTTLTTSITGDTYDFWKKAKEEGKYEDEKRKLADTIHRIICRKIPQAKDNIEVIDIATPLTFERYTGAYHGSWMCVTGLGKKMRTYPGSIKNVNGLYFAGHRLMMPGGLPVAILSGRKAAQMICRQFNVMFR